MLRKEYPIKETTAYGLFSLIVSASFRSCFNWCYICLVSLKISWETLMMCLICSRKQFPCHDCFPYHDCCHGCFYFSLQYGRFERQIL